MRLSIRLILTLALIVGLICGWGWTIRNHALARIDYQRKLAYCKEELSRAKEQLKDLRSERRSSRTRALGEVELEGANLAGMTISSDDNAFQGASFRKCDLHESFLRGGTSAFQHACFDEANLLSARLIADHAAFQLATFVKADLTRATLSGGAASFQGASFENAVMVEATCIGNFQGSNISGVKFQGANLTAIEADNLASCYFDVPPTYDKNTKFPKASTRATTGGDSMNSHSNAYIVRS